MGAEEFGYNVKAQTFNEMEDDDFNHFSDSELVYHVRDALNSVSSVSNCFLCDLHTFHFFQFNMIVLVVTLFSSALVIFNYESMVTGIYLVGFIIMAVFAGF